jgi:hypothetical protein
MHVVEGLGQVVLVDLVRQWWASNGFLMFRTAKLAQRLDLREGMLDGRDPTKRFIWLADAGNDYAFGHRSPPWGRHHGSSPILSGLHMKTWSRSLRRMTTGLVLCNLPRDVVFKTLWSFLLGFTSGLPSCPLVVRGGIGWVVSCNLWSCL